MTLVRVVVIVFVALAFTAVEAKESKACRKERRALERHDPRFKIKPGTVTCHPLHRIESRCGGVALVPSNFSINDHRSKTRGDSCILDSQLGTDECTYHKHRQCTWRFGLSEGREAQIALWNVAIEESAGCKNDYIMVDVIVDLGRSVKPEGCDLVRGKGRRLKHLRLCRFEYRLPCGQYCDPLLTDCSVDLPCDAGLGYCRRKTAAFDSLAFRFSTSDRPELAGWGVRHVHVTFRSDGSRVCRGFKGIYFQQEKAWEGKVKLFGGNEGGTKENPKPKPDPNLVEGVGRFDFNERGDQIQLYNSTDLLAVMSRAAQNSTFADKMKKHKLFKDLV